MHLKDVFPPIRSTRECCASVLVLVFATATASGANLLPNGGFEQGALYWNYFYSQAPASSEVNPENVRTGVASLEVYRRSTIYEGLNFTGTLRTILNPSFPTDVTKDTYVNDKSSFFSGLETSGPGRYVIKAYMKMASGDATAKINFQIKSNSAWGTNYNSSSIPVNSTGWTLVTATFDLTWTGTIQDTVFKITANPTTAFYIDDVSFEKEGSAPDPVPPSKPAYDTTRIENWKGGATAACSLTGDDGSSSQVTLLVPMLNTYGFKATFFHYKAVYDAGYVNPDLWRPVFADGHEFGSHGMTHASPTGLAEADVRWQLGDSKTFFMSTYNLPYIHCFATPFASGKHAPRQPLSIMPEYYPSNRGATWVFSDPAGEMIVPLLNHDPVSLPSLYWEGVSTKVVDPLYPWLNATVTAAHGNAWIDRAIAKRGWAIETIHSIVTSPANVTGTGTLQSTYDEHFAYLAAKRDAGQLWVAPMGEVARYDRARKASTISQTQVNGSQFSVTLATGALPSNLSPLVPLTVSFAVPDGWSGVEVKQGQTVLPVSTGNGRAYLDVLPTADGTTVLDVREPALSASELLSQWRLTHFGTTANAGNAAADFDFDHDGLPNLVEYALGSDPVQPEASAGPTVSVEEAAGQQYLTLTVDRTDIPSGTGCGAEVSGTLAGWTNDVTVLENTATRFKARDNTPVGGAPRFIRFTVTPP